MGIMTTIHHLVEAMVTLFINYNIDVNYIAVFIICLLILIEYHWIYVEDAPNVNGASFEIGSGTRLANDMDAKMASTEDSGLPEGAQNVSRSVISQNNIDDGEDIRPKILLMGLRR